MHVEAKTFAPNPCSNYNFADNVEGVKRVIAEDYVFLMESTSLEFEVLQNCNLTQVSQMVMGSKGYGIAFKKGQFGFFV